MRRRPETDSETEREESRLSLEDYFITAALEEGFKFYVELNLVNGYFEELKKDDISISAVQAKTYRPFDAHIVTSVHVNGTITDYLVDDNLNIWQKPRCDYFSSELEAPGEKEVLKTGYGPLRFEKVGQIRGYEDYIHCIEDIIASVKNSTEIDVGNEDGLKLKGIFKRLSQEPLIQTFVAHLYGFYEASKYFEDPLYLGSANALFEREDIDASRFAELAERVKSRNDLAYEHAKE